MNHGKDRAGKDSSTAMRMSDDRRTMKTLHPVPFSVAKKAEMGSVHTY